MSNIQFLELDFFGGFFSFDSFKNYQRYCIFRKLNKTISELTSQSSSYVKGLKNLSKSNYFYIL